MLPRSTPYVPQILSGYVSDTIPKLAEEYLSFLFFFFGGGGGLLVVSQCFAAS